MLESVVKIIRGIMKLRGGTDNTIIGNSGDSLKVTNTTVISNREEWNDQIIKGNGYCFTTLDGQLSVGTADKPVLYLKNNSGTKTVYIYSIFMVADAAVPGNWLEYRLYYQPTITVNGTALTIVNGIAGNSSSSVANAYANPTASSKGSLIRVWEDGAGNSPGPLKQPSANRYWILPPGTSLLVTASAKGNSTIMYGTFDWFEF